MKLTATAEKLNSDDKKSDIKKLKSENGVKSLPKRIKLRSVDVHIPEDKHNWESLRTQSKFQVVLVPVMVLLLLVLIDFFIGRKINDFVIFVMYFWSSIVFMALASLSTFLVAHRPPFQTSCYIVTAMSFQCCATFMWLVFVFGGTAVLVTDKKVSGFDTVLMKTCLVIDSSAAVVATFSVCLLWSVGGFEGMKKVRKFNNRYGDVVFEVIEVTAASGQGTRRPMAPDEGPRK